MNTSVREAGPHERLVTFVISSSDLDQAMDSAARKLSRELKIKGFRPGKAPRRVVEAAVGSDRLRSEAIENSIPTLLGDALTDAEITPVVTPSLERIDDVDEGVEVEVRVTTWPDVPDLPPYRGKEIEVEGHEVDEEELQSQIDRLRDQYAELEVVSRPAQEEDFVSINLTATHHGQPIEEASASDFLYEVGSKSFIEGIDEHLVGRAAGEIVKFNAPLPDGFGEFGGREVTVQALVKDVRRKELPELTDEWVAQVSEFETVSELRTELNDQLRQVKRAAVVSQFQSRVLEMMLSELELDLPEAILGAEMDKILHRFLHQLESQDLELTDYLEVTGQSQEDFLNDLRSQADRNARTDILLDAIAGEEGVEVTEDDLTETMQALAAQAGEDFEELRARLAGTSQEIALKSDILRKKALTALLEAAVPVDQKGRPIDLTKHDDVTFAEPPPEGEADKVET